MSIWGMLFSLGFLQINSNFAISIQLLEMMKKLKKESFLNLTNIINEFNENVNFIMLFRGHFYQKSFSKVGTAQESFHFKNSKFVTRCVFF
jgi:hypothetical protein